MYSIGQVAKMMNVSVPTLRYYDSEGLLIHVKRDSSGNRIFDDRDLDALKMIHCLKQSGLKIKEIKDFMDLCKQGNESLNQRLAFFYAQEKKIRQEIEKLEKCLSLVKYKQWYYKTALEHEDENYVKGLNQEELPEDIKKLYIESHN